MMRVSHHMRSPVPLALAVAFVLVGCSPTNKGPLSFESPADWKVEHKTPGGIDFYTLTAKTPGGGLLMFSQWPAPTRPEDIPASVQKLADGYRERAKKSTEFTLASSDYKVEQLAGEHCQGSYAAFQITSGDTNTVQALFMMSAAGRVWNGQFAGPPDAWKQALEVLKSIR